MRELYKTAVSLEKPSDYKKPISAGAWYFMVALLAFAITIGLPSIIIGAALSFKLSGI